MLPDRVSNPGPLTYESGALPIAAVIIYFAKSNLKCLLYYYNTNNKVFTAFYTKSIGFFKVVIITKLEQKQKSA